MKITQDKLWIFIYDNLQGYYIFLVSHIEAVFARFRPLRQGVTSKSDNVTKAQTITHTAD
jgi:hypothetical protein